MTTNINASVGQVFMAGVAGTLLLGTILWCLLPRPEVPQQEQIEVIRMIHDTVYVDTCYYNDAIDHIKSYEGFRSTCYRDNDGSLTIGYGHHLRKGESYSLIDEATAEKLLVEDLTRCVSFVERHTELRSNKSLAMGMLAYNCGTGKVKGYIERGLLDNIESLPQYCHYTNQSGKKVKSKKLQERRNFELLVYTNDI